MVRAVIRQTFLNIIFHRKEIIQNIQLMLDKINVYLAFKGTNCCYDNECTYLFYFILLIYLTILNERCKELILKSRLKFISSEENSKVALSCN